MEEKRKGGRKGGLCLSKKSPNISSTCGKERGDSGEERQHGFNLTLRKGKKGEKGLGGFLSADKKRRESSIPEETLRQETTSKEEGGDQGLDFLKRRP